MPHSAKKFLGNGLNFPLKLNPRGEIMLITGSQDIEQSIRIILGTRPGERVMRPEFGCRAQELLFEPRSAATISMLQEYVLESLTFWEPRIEVQSVNVNDDGNYDGSLIAEIIYLIKSTHDTRSIVYPFFIEEEEEIY
ncbi:MAG: GPW/gp25 family protein [Anaerolineaceae bacterium]|nr:GPW/gp25 family protein [Anaerolineaceae bacterium]